MGTMLMPSSRVYAMLPKPVKTILNEGCGNEDASNWQANASNVLMPSVISVSPPSLISINP